MATITGFLDTSAGILICGLWRVWTLRFLSVLTVIAETPFGKGSWMSFLGRPKLFIWPWEKRSFWKALIVVGYAIGIALGAFAGYCYHGAFG